MKDGVEAREALRAACELATSEVGLLRIVRFRGATLGSIGGDVAGAITDAVFGGDDGATGEGPDTRPAGLALVALRRDGGPAGRLMVHPADDDLEAYVTGLALDARARIGCSVELFVEGTPLVRFDEHVARPRGGGYRDAPPDLAAPFVGTSAQVTRDGEQVRVVHETPVRTSSLFLPLVVVLVLVFWWAMLLALLFRDGRDFVFGVFRTVTRKGPRRWEATLGPRELRVTPDEGAPTTIALERARLVSLAPWGSTRAEAKGAPVLRLLVDGAFVPIDTPLELRAPLAEALRRALGAA